MLHSNLLRFSFLFPSHAFQLGCLPSSHPVTVHTLCLNTNTARCCSASISQPVHACYSEIAHIQMACMLLLPLISLRAVSNTLSIFSGKLPWRFGREWQDFPVSKETVPFPPLVTEECWRSIPVYVSDVFFVSCPWYGKQKRPIIEEVRSSLWLTLVFFTSLKGS